MTLVEALSLLLALGVFGAALAIIGVRSAKKRKNENLLRIANAVLNVARELPSCQHEGCRALAEWGVVSHDPEWCEEHSKEPGRYGLRNCGWVEAMRELQAILEELGVKGGQP